MIGKRTVKEWAAILTADDSEVRRLAFEELRDGLKYRSKDAPTRHAALALVKLLKASDPAIAEALNYKLQLESSALWIMIVSGDDPDMVDVSEFQELDRTINAVEWHHQRIAPAMARCLKCKKAVATTANKVSVPCPQCSQALRVIRWLYNSKGIPIVFLDGEYAVTKYGTYLGNLEGHQIWESGYEGEIADGDRLYIAFYKGGWARRGFHKPNSIPKVPPLPPDKKPVDEARRTGQPRPGSNATGLPGGSLHLSLGYRWSRARSVKLHRASRWHLGKDGSFPQ